jgi:alkylhydroperoxidase family enzyme
MSIINQPDQTILQRGHILSAGKGEWRRPRPKLTGSTAAKDEGRAMRKAFLCLGVLFAVFLMGPIRAENAAVSRLPPLPDPSDSYLQAMFAKIRAAGGQPLNIHLVSGFAPKLAKARLDLAYALRYDTVTLAPLREIAILRTAQLVHSDYELDQHVVLARACGISDAQIAALPDWRASSLFDGRQRALLAYTEAVDENGGEVDDATYDALAKQFRPQEIVELTMTITSYYSTGQFLKALKVKPESDGRRSALPKC